MVSINTKKECDWFRPCQLWFFRPRPYWHIAKLAKKLTWSRKVVETFWIHQNVRNGHIYIQLMSYEATYGLKCLLFEKFTKKWFLHDRVAKNHNFRYRFHNWHTIVSCFLFCEIQRLNLLLDSNYVKIKMGNDVVRKYGNWST